MGKLMAIFNVTNRRSDATVTPLPIGAFRLSTLAGNRCVQPNLHQVVDNIGYFDASSYIQTLPNVGDVVYFDAAKTILYNNSNIIQDYNINGGLFISLDEDSKLINNHCK